MPGLQLNHLVQIDTIFLNRKPVVHLVEEITDFISASFLRNKSTNKIWKAISGLRFYTYMGSPDFLAVDQVTPYISREMKGR